MATTYELIASNVLGASASSVTFSSIPGTYTDLAIVVSGRSTNTSNTDGQMPLLCKFNNTDLSITRRHLYATGVSALSAATSTTNRFLVTGLVNSNAAYTANTFSSVEIYIPNYTGTTNKSISATAVMESNKTSIVYMEASAGLVPLTSAITQLEFYPQSDQLSAGSSFYLFGITKF